MGANEEKGKTIWYLNAVVVARVDVAREAEIGDLHRQVVADEAVARRQVAVNVVVRRQVLHT